MARRSSSSEQDVGGLAVLATVVGGPVAIWHYAGVWCYPLLAALVAGAVLLVVVAVRRTRARRAHQALLDQQFSVTQGMTGTQFEELTARLLRAAGWVDARRVGGAGDLGADVVATHGGQRLVVQCKRFGSRKVSSPDVQRFLGTVFHVHHADVAAFVTTSTFTPAARDLAERTGVVCVDGTALAHWQAYGAPGWVVRPQHGVALTRP